MERSSKFIGIGNCEIGLNTDFWHFRSGMNIEVSIQDHVRSLLVCQRFGLQEYYLQVHFLKNRWNYHEEVYTG
jgi:hypothetical protein